METISRLLKQYKANMDSQQNYNDSILVPQTKETADPLFREVYQMYWDGYDDSCLLLPMMEALISYYETNEDFKRLAFLYSAAYYEESVLRILTLT